MKTSYYKKIELFSSFILSFLSVFCFSQSFHDTKGNIEVNKAGQLQFSLPIDVPPGIKSVSPHISLVYNSESGNGIAGYGWRISGINTITRTGKNIENAGEVKSIQMDYSDYYSFNGQRLILKSGEYGKDGAEYVTEKYSNTKFKSVGSENPAQPWQGPEYWEVTFEDGSQAWYGNDLDRTPMEYYMTEWKDPQGNYISYNYNLGDRLAMISSIEWGGNKDLNTPHINTIQFNYSDRVLKEESYIRGLKFYQSKILSEVKVLTGNKLFKRYGIEYTGNGTNYQFTGKITEYNANNEPANPVIFNYPPMVNSSYKEFLASESFENVKLVGDFNGDSYLDFLMNDGTVKLGAFNETFSTISTGKVFGHNAKVASTLLDEEGQVYNGNGIVEFKDSKVVGYIFKNNDFVKVFEKDLTNTVLYGSPDSLLLEVGDFDGDGIPDAFVDNGYPNGFNSRGIIDLKNPNVSATLLLSTINSNSYPDQKYMDIDGDGKVEIINVSGSTYNVFEFIKTGPHVCEIKIRFSGNLLETKDPEFPVLYGDYNGDGRLDFAIPITDYAIGKPDDWRFYMGTEKGFVPFLKKEFFTYRKLQTEMTGNYAKFAKQYFFSVTDMNKDGKSDILQVFSYNQINMFNAGGSRDFGYVVNSRVENGSDINGTPNFIPSLVFQSQQFHTQDLLDLTLFTPITNSIKSGNNYYNVFLYWKDRLNKIQGPTPVSELARVSSITQGGVTTNIKYLEVVPDNIHNSNFYKKQKKEFYPYYSLSRADQAYAVSQLEEEGKMQDFRYRGLTGNMDKKSLTGYYQTAHSSWYANGFESTKIWSGSEIDPILDGAPVKQWSIRTNNENSIFPADISENNTDLLTFESVTYQTDKLINGHVQTSIPPVYKPIVVTASIPKITKTKDFTTNSFKEKWTTYDNYYLPTKVETNYNYGYAVSTIQFEYQHNINGIGKDYYVGRPISKVETMNAYGDSKKNIELYQYSNNLLNDKRSFPQSNISSAFRENYSYDGFGNITEKNTISGIDGSSKIEKNKYDLQGRFIINTTDNLGLENVITYNDWGQILTTTDPDGKTLTNTYDSWGKLLTSTSSIVGTTSYQYQKDPLYNTTVTRNDPDGDISKILTNKLGQKYKATSKAFGQGQYVSKETQYDLLGRKIKESEPYFEGQFASKWNTFIYDDTVFPAKVTATAFTGKQVETNIFGLTTTIKETNIADYGRITSQTMDILGNIISSTDKGGTVNFTYNAAGQQIQAKYEENIVNTAYDNWGNKVRVEDPSTGVYEYEYTGYMGSLSKAISPRGEKIYKYNNLGQLISQSEFSTIDGGDTTKKEISFTYDGKGRLTSKKGITNGKSYTNTIKYDSQGRILSYLQKCPDAVFDQREITYDSNGRIDSYVKQIITSGASTTARIRNIYNSWNGELYQVMDKSSGKILWELKDTNSYGMVLSAKLGETGINNTYDSNGFLTNVNHSSTQAPNLLNLSYTFDAIKNELNIRKSDFKTEHFNYDDNNRLAIWTDPTTGLNTGKNIYDIKGRIFENNEIGTIKYENTEKIYQPTGMSLNSNGLTSYNQDLVQTVLYNENNDPVFIDGKNGDVGFLYGLTDMRQNVTYGGNFSPTGKGKFSKISSEEGSFEIIRDNGTGMEKHIIYIGSTPYESDIVFLKNYNEKDGNFKFLHKDYLGSILAITDHKGTMLERRHFDAWGNLTHFQTMNGALGVGKQQVTQILGLNGGLLIDRGYTGHEHFLEVGIIHMNGRLYDPLLRRFLNADEYIQSPFNTQSYNRYGYVMNNPMMYNDPNGEFVWILAGAVIGAYFTGVKANGSFNPIQWNWGATWGKIAMGGAIGAFTGGVGAAVGASAATYAAASWGISGGVLGGAISGAAGGAVAGAINGFATSVMFGENVLQGTLMGGLVGGAFGGAAGGIVGGIQQIAANAKVTATNIGTKGTILKGAPIAEGRSAWTLNNTPKTSTVGIKSVKNTLIVGDIEHSMEQTVSYKIDPVTEQIEAVTVEGPKTISKGEFTKTTISSSNTEGFGSMMEAGEASRYAQYWQNYAPKLSPGTTRMDWVRFSGRTGRMETSRVIYDKFGRQTYRVDLSDHMRPSNHSVPHLHEYQFGPGFDPIKGKETVYNFWNK